MIPLFEPSINKTRKNNMTNITVKLLTKLFLSIDGVEKVSNTFQSKEQNILEEINCCFTPTKQTFICQIKEFNNTLMVYFQLYSDCVLSDEELNICKKIHNELSSVDIMFKVDNELETFAYGDFTKPTNHISKEQSTIETKNIVESEQKIEDSISDIQPIVENTTINKENKISEKIIDVVKNNISQENTTKVETGNTWKEINQRMKELKLPFNIVNRIRVQKNNFVKKYKDDYEKYIKEYAENQFELFIQQNQN